jgi:hypothetical protein
MRGARGESRRRLAGAGLLWLAFGCSSGDPAEADGAAPDALPSLPDAPPPARLETNRTEVELMTAIGRATWAPVLIWNHGGQDSGRPVVTVTGDWFSSMNESCGEAGIRAGGSCVIQIGFEPKGPEMKTGTAVLQGMPGGTVSLMLIGRPVPAAPAR